MTTEPHRNARSARTNVHLYLATLLAGAYLFAWWTLGTGASPNAAATENLQRQPTPPPPPHAVVWYDDLAVSNRPVVHLAPGWEITTATPSSPLPGAETRATEARHRPVRVVPTRSGRVRTRSS